MTPVMQQQRQGDGYQMVSQKDDGEDRDDNNNK
jgi:hypothetical protein